MSNYTATIGLEVHVELATKSKMFCGCKNCPHDSEVNANICPVCMAHPGSLPVPNEEAIAMVLLFGTAVGATPATYSEFDRKNYFYPDIPKAYQISQYAFPFLTSGKLAGVELTRVHLEEDTARSQHDKGEESLVDYNRAGVPLMELVTEPVIHDAKTAGNFARELQLLLKTLGISAAHMDRGEMRVEANISVSLDEQILGTKVEVKNLNSFRSVEGAIAYEIDRQVNLLTQGGAVVQETRGWDEVKLKTFSQRAKETAKDYRYFPDPDLPKMIVGEYSYFKPSRLNEILPELPDNKRKKYNDIGLTISQIEIIIANTVFDTLYADVFALVPEGPARNEILLLAGNYLVSDVGSALGAMVEIELTASNFLELMTMVHANEITSRVAKDLLPELLTGNVSPRALAKERNLLRSGDDSVLLPIVMEVLTENSAVAAEYRAGKESSLQFLIGQGMKKSRGSADPEVLSTLLKKELS